MDKYFNRESFDFKIEKKENNFFFITLNEPNKELLFSLTKTGILVGSTITDNYQSLIMKANTLHTLNSDISLNYNNLLNIFYSLSTQLNYLLENENKCFLTFDPAKIIILDNHKFFYLSNELFTINKDQTIPILKPFLKSKYNPPELQNINSLPSTVHFKTIYFRLASLIIELINLNKENLENKKSNYLKNTKLYFALKRCLKKNPKERVILFV